MSCRVILTLACWKAGNTHSCTREKIYFVGCRRWTEKAIVMLLYTIASENIEGRCRGSGTVCSSLFLTGGI